MSATTMLLLVILIVLVGVIILGIFIFRLFHYSPPVPPVLPPDDQHIPIPIPLIRTFTLRSVIPIGDTPHVRDYGIGLLTEIPDALIIEYLTGKIYGTLSIIDIEVPADKIEHVLKSDERGNITISGNIGHEPE